MSVLISTLLNDAHNLFHSLDRPLDKFNQTSQQQQIIIITILINYDLINHMNESGKNYIL